MNEKHTGSEPEPRPGGPAIDGGIRRLLEELFPDLDPDRVAEALELPGVDDGEREER